jgi:hypothetical protein
MMIRFLMTMLLALCLVSPRSTEAITKTYTPEAAAAIERTATVTFLPEGAVEGIVIGSGWAVKKDGSFKLVTAQHVGLALAGLAGSLEFCSIENECVAVDFRQGVGPVLGAGTTLDWIYWEVDELPRGLRASRVGGDPVIGEPVCVAGAPLGRVGEYTCGQVTNDLGPFFYLDARVLPGNSGGPVFDQRGRVIGMVVSIDFPEGLPPVENSAIAIQVDQIWL